MTTSPRSGSARQWAQRLLSPPRPAAKRDAGPLDNAWTMQDGRLFFVVGFTPGGAPCGIYEDEMEPCDDAPF